MPMENKVTNEFKDFYLCIRKRVALGCCIPNFITLFALLKISEIQADWGASHGRNIFFQNMKNEPNKRVHTKFHGSRWKINNFLTIIKRVSMIRQLPTRHEHSSHQQNSQATKSMRQQGCLERSSMVQGG